MYIILKAEKSEKKNYLKFFWLNKIYYKILIFTIKRQH